MGSSSSQEQETKQQQLARQYTPDKRYGAHEVGYHARRGCTDLCGFLIYFAAWVVMMMVAFTAYSQGNPLRLLYGLDRFGNLCGHDSEVENRKYLAYPFPSYLVCMERSVDPNPPTCEDLIKDTLKLGLCVEVCPRSGETVYYYDGSESVNGTHVSFTAPFDTKPVLHRCVMEEASDLPGEVADTLRVAGTLRAAFAELERSAPVLAVSLVAAVIISFLWLFILRRTVKPTVFVTLFLVFLASAFVTYVTFINWRKADETKGLWLLFFVLSAGFFVLYTLLCVFFCKNINVACDTIEEASKIPLSIPTMAIVPPVIVLFLVVIFSFHVVTALYIQTIGDLDTEEMEAFINTTDPSGALGPSATVTIRALKEEDWVTYAHLFNVFMFFWSSALFNSIGFLVLAFCAVFWYWSVPGDRKKPPAGVFTAWTWTVRYHLGTVMLGSFIIAIVQFIRFLLARMEDRMRNITENNSAAQCVVKCIHCCLACFERMLKFINRNAYIMTALCSDSFCAGARRALFLLLRHAFSVIAVNFIADWVMIFGKIQISGACVALAWYLHTRTDIVSDEKEPEDCIVTLIAVAFLSYLVATVFVSVFAVCVDTVLLSFCYDLDVNNGTDRPYYLPSDLQRSLDVHNVTTVHTYPAHNLNARVKDGISPLERPLIN